MKKIILSLGAVALLAVAGYYLWPAGRNALVSGKMESAAPDSAAGPDLSPQAEIARTELRIQQLMLRRAEMDSAEFLQALADEKELLHNLKGEVQDQREVQSTRPPEEKPAAPAPEAVTDTAKPALSQALSALLDKDRSFALIFAIIAFLIIIVLALLIRVIWRGRGQPAESEEEETYSPGPAPEARPAPDILSIIKAGTGSQDLKKTMEAFQSQRPDPSVPTPSSLDQNSSLVETVYFYADQGLSEKEIAEKLRLDVDRVRLMIKFKR